MTRRYAVSEMDAAFERYHSLLNDEPKNFWLWVGVKGFPTYALNDMRDGFILTDEGGKKVDMLLSPHHKTLIKVWEINNHGKIKMLTEEITFTEYKTARSRWFEFWGTPPIQPFHNYLGVSHEWQFSASRFHTPKWFSMSIRAPAAKKIRMLNSPHWRTLLEIYKIKKYPTKGKP